MPLSSSLERELRDVDRAQHSLLSYREITEEKRIERGRGREVVMGSSDPLVPVLLFFVLSSPLLSFSSAVAFDLEAAPTLSFEEGYTQTFGNDNLMLLRNGRTVHVALDERTGAGFASQDLYRHGFFSASIKLPSDYAAGVVVAFYMSNGDMYEKTHDELDFEFLGNIRGREWRVQTNVYSNGSTRLGREERYELWFDPTEDFHRYSILWSQDRIIFYIDKIPVREIERSKSMGGAFPSKPMSLYATIWDGSSWATSGGRYKVNYNYAPYVAEFADLVLHGCAVNPIDHSSSCNERDAARYNSVTISPEERVKMERFRRNHMTYSYCYDRDRYATPPQDCSIDRSEVRHSYGYDGARFGSHHNHHGRRRHHRNSPSSADAAL